MKLIERDYAFDPSRLVNLLSCDRNETERKYRRLNLVILYFSRGQIRVPPDTDISVPTAYAKTVARLRRSELCASLEDAMRESDHTLTLDIWERFKSYGVATARRIDPSLTTDLDLVTAIVEMDRLEWLPFDVASVSSVLKRAHQLKYSTGNLWSFLEPTYKGYIASFFDLSLKFGSPLPLLQSALEILPHQKLQDAIDRYGDDYRDCLYSVPQLAYILGYVDVGDVQIHDGKIEVLRMNVRRRGIDHTVRAVQEINRMILRSFVGPFISPFSIGPICNERDSTGVEIINYSPFDIVRYVTDRGTVSQISRPEFDRALFTSQDPWTGNRLPDYVMQVIAHKISFAERADLPQPAPLREILEATLFRETGSVQGYQTGKLGPLPRGPEEEAAIVDNMLSSIKESGVRFLLGFVDIIMEDLGI